MHSKRYQELISKYSISNSILEPEDKTKYEVIVRFQGHYQSYQRYRVIYNAPGLDAEDLAIICTKGDLNFGYKVADPYICIGTK